MSRPLGVGIIAAGVVASTVFTLNRVLHVPGGHRTRALLFTAVLLAFLALAAAEALWNLRPHAFLAFVLWGIAAVAAAAVLRLSHGGSAHLARFVPTIVYTGLAFAAAALYLRRAL